MHTRLEPNSRIVSEWISSLSPSANPAGADAAAKASSEQVLREELE